MEPKVDLRAKFLNETMEGIETILAEKGITIGEWNMIAEAINNRQNKLLISNLVQKYVEPTRSNIVKPE